MMASNSGLGKLVSLGILAVLLYFGWTKGLPWLQGALGSGGSGGAGGEGEGGRCVELASRASEALGSRIGQFSPSSIDLEAWDNVRSDVEDQISDAQYECGCDLDSCAKAMEALDALSELLSNWDDGFRGSRTPLNPARQQLRIDRLINEATGLARQGQ